ncbi:MAG: hypothetical protein LBV50_12250 [Novosphingobium sp.]|jgi:hypothetical protein|nr:hypothetical protein [Novosphingobium sp.]
MASEVGCAMAAGGCGTGFSAATLAVRTSAACPCTARKGSSGIPVSQAITRNAAQPPQNSISATSG